MRGNRANLQLAALFLASAALGLSIRLLVVLVTPDVESSGLCTPVTDFWNGDQVLC